ncbi:hypothetical protein N9L31_00255 [bacterium]|nr:hypothetical protein [bacterium]
MQLFLLALCSLCAQLLPLADGQSARPGMPQYKRREHLTPEEREQSQQEVADQIAEDVKCQLCVLGLLCGSYMPKVDVAHVSLWAADAHC